MISPKWRACSQAKAGQAMCLLSVPTLVYVVIQFYPWFKFSFLLFQAHYHVIVIHYHTQKQKKRKFKPMIKLNHNIYIERANLRENIHV